MHEKEEKCFMQTKGVGLGNIPHEKDTMTTERGEEEEEEGQQGRGELARC